MTNSRQKGKRVELQVAHALGVERNKSDGTSHTDIYTETQVIEVKARAKLPALLHDAMAQALDDPRYKRNPLLTPVVVLVETRPGAKKVAYAMLQFKDYFGEELT